jgi:DNA-binding LytR/AlgR family response regulator
MEDSMIQKRIAIVDDEVYHLNILKQHVNNCSLWKHLRLTVKSYDDGQILLRDLNLGLEFDFIFLDINMPEINGIDLCNRILQITETSIIFVSTHMEKQPSVDKLYPAMLLPKPYTQDNFDNIVKAFQARKDALRNFEFTHNGEKCTVKCRDIYYFSMADHHLMITTNRGTYQDATMNLSDVEREYSSETFFRCHKSHLINLRYYDSHRYTNVNLKCGDKIVSLRLSKGKGESVKNAYLKKIVGGYDAF